MPDLPHNSNFDLDVVRPRDWIPDAQWEFFNDHTYVLLKDGISVEEFESRLNLALKKNQNGNAHYQNITLSLQNLSDIHLNPQSVDELKHPGNKLVLYLMGIAFIIVLLVAWVNHVNFELRSSKDAETLQAKMHAYVDKRVGSQLREWNEWMDFVFQPVTSIHLNSNEPDEIAENGNGKSVTYLTIIAVIILVIAWINYINLATARSLERGREVGIRKILGSTRKQLIRQFLFESFMFKLVATILSCGILIVLLPSFSSMMNRTFDISILYSTEILVTIAVIFFIGALSVAIYPALVMSGYKPLLILKGFASSGRGELLRKTLVTIQFVCSASLIAALFIVYKQIHFMQTTATGLQADKVLVVHGPMVYDEPAYRSRFNSFRNSLLTNPPLQGVTVSTDVPGHAVRNISGNVRVVGQSVEKGNSYQGILANEDFLATYGLRLIAGRNFSGDDKDEWNAVIVNETSMRMLGFNEPEKLLGHKIYIWDSEPEVVGVISDYHHQSLRSKISPIIIVFDKGITQYFSVRFDARMPLNDLIAEVKNQYVNAFPGNPFHYFFMDEYFDHQYKADVQFAHLFNVLTLLIVVIAGLGLFGLSSYIVFRRKKEISIRKLLGASLQQIVILTSKNFMTIVSLANIIAWPIVFFIMNLWLDQFAYRVDVGYTSFITSFVLTMIIATSTVAIQSVMAATSNLMTHLRSE